MMRKMPIDESLAFTVQLELRPGLSGPEGEKWRAALLGAWYAQEGDKNFWTFARKWDRGVVLVVSDLPVSDLS